MTYHAAAGGRIALMGLLVAGALAGTASSASAQYYSYYDEGDPFPPYREFRQRDYGYRYAPPPPSVRVAPNDAGRHFAARNYGLARVDRSIDRGNLRIIDGVAADGRHLRIVLDAWSGDILRRITLPSPPQPAPRVARIDPRDVYFVVHKKPDGTYTGHSALGQVDKLFPKGTLITMRNWNTILKAAA